MQTIEELAQEPESIQQLQGPYQVTSVSKTTIQSLGKRLEKRTGFNVIESAQMRQISDFTFDLEASQLTTDTLKRRTYTVPFLEKGDKYSTFNLVMVADSVDNVLEQYVLQYEFDSIQFHAFEQTKDLILSGAALKRYSFSSFFNDSNPGFLERCNGIFDNNGDPIPCETISNIANATQSGGGGGSSGGSTYTLDLGAFGGSSCTASLAEQKVVTCTAKDHPGSGCDKETTQWVIIVNCIPSPQKRLTNNIATMQCESCDISDFGSPAFTLTRDATQIDNLLTDYSLSQWHMAYLSNNSNFSSELKSAFLSDPNLDQEAGMFTIHAGMNGAFTGNFNDTFILSVEGLLVPSEADLTYDPIQWLFQYYFEVRYGVLKLLNPSWSKGRLFYETAKEAIHYALDGAGLIPGFGEPADLINAGLYFIEGDRLNGTLSLTAAIPFVGWFSTTAKGAVKFIGYLPGTNKKMSHVWGKIGNQIIFGGTDLRKVLQLTYPTKHAHHIIPVELVNHEVVQKAAKADIPFHINEYDNGIPVESWQNTTHPAYNNRVREILERYKASYKNFEDEVSPKEAYQFLQFEMAKLKNLISNNSTTKINDLVFK
jgi:hypothetical protein